MKEISASALDRRIQFQRFSETDDGYGMVEKWDDHGAPIWAGRRDVSDAERAAAGWIEATLASRFTVRSSEFTRAITPKDRVANEGMSFDIVGIKQMDRRGFLEITAVARADL